MPPKPGLYIYQIKLNKITLRVKSVVANSVILNRREKNASCGNRLSIAKNASSKVNSSIQF